jgi:hypothetical protein
VSLMTVHRRKTGRDSLRSSDAAADIALSDRFLNAAAQQ